MKRVYLGELEEIVLLTTGVLDNEAYGVAIKREMEERLGRNVSMGALHSALRRMEAKGYITSKLGEATRERGGKRKRYFKVTQEGHKALQEVMDIRRQLWAALPKNAFTY